jgi:hypothetical protein
MVGRKCGELNRHDAKSGQGRRELGRGELNRQGAKIAKEGRERKREGKNLQSNNI